MNIRDMFQKYFYYLLKLFYTKKRVKFIGPRLQGLGRVYNYIK